MGVVGQFMGDCGNQYMFRHRQVLERGIYAYVFAAGFAAKTQNLF
jgi:hypothetical protein